MMHCIDYYDRITKMLSPRKRYKTKITYMWTTKSQDSKLEWKKKKKGMSHFCEIK